MDGKTISVELRSEKGKNNARRLRREGLIPGVYYSHGEAQPISIPRKDFTNLFKGKISESVIFNLKFSNSEDDSEAMAFVKDYQFNPINGELIHLDLFRVTRGEKINTTVPIEFTGTPKGTRVGGILEYTEREVEVECLPKDLPEKIVLDISGVELDEYIFARDIELGDEVTLMSNPDSVIISVHSPRMAAEEEEVEGEEAALEEGEEEKEAEESGE